MHIKTWIRLFTPPILLDLYQGGHIGSIWKGIYKRFDEVPVREGGYDSDTWIQARVEPTQVALKEFRQHGSLPEGTIVGERSFLPLVAALLSASQKRNDLTILDFGGSTGIEYIYLLNSVTNCQSLNYHVVDTEGSCQAGRSIFKDNFQITFYSSLPEHVPGLDLININAALQYVDDYQGVLAKLCAYNASFILFVRLDAGDITSRVSGQVNVKGSIIPCWAFNMHDIMSIMRQHGYELAFRGSAQQRYDQTNLPRQYQLTYGSNLLFVKSKVHQTS